jgi:cell division protein FtsQ
VTEVQTVDAPPRPRVRSPWRTAFFGLAGLSVIAVIAWVVLGSPLLVVRQVTVHGTSLVPASEVLAAAGVPVGTSLVSVNTGQVAQRVETIRQVASATVAKDWPDTLAITVTERVPAMAVRMAAGGFDLVDPTGVIVRWSAARPAGLPLYLTSVPGTALRGDARLATAAAVIAELPPWLSRQLAQLSAAGPPAPADPAAGGPDQVTLYLRDHKTIVWGGTDRAADKSRELAILLRGGASYLDVSAPGTVVTR